MPEPRRQRTLPGDMVLSYLLLVALLVLSMFFSGSETALFNLAAHQRQQLQQSPDRSSRAAAVLLQRPDQLLITLLLGNLTVNVLYFATSSLLALEWSRRLPAYLAGVVGVVPLVLLIVLGEVLPKALAMAHPVRFARWVAGLTAAVVRVLGPIANWLNLLFVRPSIRLLTPAPAAASGTVTHEELSAALDASSREGLIDRQTGALLREVVELHSIRVREVMVPRVDLKAFDLSESREQFLALVAESGLKRVPVYRDDLDHIVGVVDARAVLAAPQRSIESLVEPIPIVPDLIDVEHLLHEFRRTGRQAAIVVDEYGGTAGLVTLEDLVEEIVGDIYDPRDRPVEPIRSLGADEFRVAGDLSVREWSKIFGQAPAGQTVYTIAGLITAELGRAPRVGDEVRWRNLTFHVEEVQRHRVRWARIRREKADAENAAEDAATEKGTIR